ncbi:hypothetical protein ElyMa_006287900 [Elysia marginata]|uniref:Uncharacterized protein n=1 Tax=Elysia marginata TaxID=1093978 RepID=A0AAV4HGU0_9GAST|nr:hypothetical protein ElyMa_006287900 [Elysia marginata]
MKAIGLNYLAQVTKGFSGKTTYDDTNLAVICDNQSDSEPARSYHSSGNFLLVVFSSSSHVLHSGGGVKIQYSSISLDNQADDRDKRLLYTLVGLFVAVACLTAFFAVLRFVIIPARQNKSTRRLDILAMSRAAGLGDLPPPYTSRESIVDTQGIENAYGTPNFHFPTPPASRSFSVLPWRSANQTSTDYRNDITPPFSQPTRVHTEPHSAIITSFPEAAAAAENDYQELPFFTLRRANEDSQQLQVEDFAHGEDQSGFVAVVRDGGSNREEMGMAEEEEDVYYAEAEIRQGRISLTRNVDGFHGGSTVIEHYLRVPMHNEARFSSDSGFTEGEQCGVGEVLNEEEDDRIYHKLTELSSSDLSLSEYVNSSSLPAAARCNLEFQRDLCFHIVGTELDVMTWKSDKNVSSLKTSSAKQLLGDKESLKDITLQCEGKEVHFSNEKPAGSEEGYAAVDKDENVYNDDELVYTKDNYQNKTQEQQKKTQPFQLLPKSHHPLNPTAKKEKVVKPPISLDSEQNKDAELEENGYKIPSNLIQSKLALQKDIDVGDIKRGAKDVRCYDHLALNGINVEEVEYQVLDVGES